MNPSWPEIVWRQFDAALDMFEKGLRDCPDELWQGQLWQLPGDPPGFSEFWYVAYHTLFWVDLYLGGAVEGFAPPAPYNLDELDPAGLLPERTYTRAELLAYVDHCRAKGRQRVAGMSEAEAQRLCSFPWGEVCYAELVVDNLRHVQEHGAQLNLFLGQQANRAARWTATMKGG